MLTGVEMAILGVVLFLTGTLGNFLGRVIYANR